MNTLPLWFVCLCFAGLGGVVWLLIAGERSTQRRPLRLCSVGKYEHAMETQLAKHLDARRE